MKRQSRFLKRIVRPYFVVLAVILSVAVVVVYTASVEKIKNEVSNTGRQIAVQSARRVDMHISELQLLAEQVISRPDITSYFYNIESDKKLQTAGNYFDKDILNSINISSALMGILVKRTETVSISVYNKYGDYVSSQNYLVAKRGLLEMMSNNDFDAELRQIEENGGVVVLPPSKNPWIMSDELYITVRVALKNQYSDLSCGFVEVRSNVRNIEELVGENNLVDLGNGESVRVMLSDRMSGSVVYPVTYYPETMANDYITAPLSKAQWEVAVENPNPMTVTYTLQIIGTFVLIYAALIGFLLLLANVMGRHIIKPVTELTEHVRSVDAPGAGKMRLEGQVPDEISELENSFNSMLSRMEKSMRQEKKAYSLALQAQMNPHFLYNMLAVIGSVGSEAGSEEVEDMCVKLSEMLRYTADYSHVTVSMREELEYTDRYLSLMKSRYEEHLTYTIDAEEGLLDIEVPKMLLQPLVENSFKHGFKDKLPPWNVSVKLSGNRKHWTLLVKDNGSGVSEEKLIEINNKISNFMSNMSVGEIGGLGIANTVVTLKMMSDRNVKYSIFNDNGFTVVITGEEK